MTRATPAAVVAELGRYPGVARQCGALRAAYSRAQGWT
jgi:hypothetical protein